MSQPSRYVRILIHTDGDLESRTLRLPLWFVRGAAGAGIIAFGVLLIAAALYLPLAAAAVRVPGLEREIGRLEQENGRIRELTAALDSAESRYDRIRSMLGADIVPDPVQVASALPVAPAIRAATPGTALPETGPSLPRHWPLDEAGYITRGQVGAGGREESHPGIDIAIPEGSLVRAAGGGRVAETGQDEEYGRYVLLEHPDGYQTMYGHLNRVTVRPAQPVSAGEVIGLSGNTGRSSAPHLHFEPRRDGKPVDPTGLIKEGQ
jgi:murein DD-endopeptidase MepM/ murein hydrolase activator NlpD